MFLRKASERENLTLFPFLYLFPQSYSRNEDMINNGHESMYKHGGRYLDCRFFPSPVSLFCVFFLFRALSKGVMGLHMDIPCLVGKLPLSVYDYIPHFLEFVYTYKKRSLIERVFGLNNDYNIGA